jgi:hypothetical protein
MSSVLHGNAPNKKTGYDNASSNGISHQGRSLTDSFVSSRKFVVVPLSQTPSFFPFHSLLNKTIQFAVLHPFSTTSVGPVSLVGGTAAIYTSLLRHPSSTLTQLSFVYMMLLALQYALQPKLSRKYISPKIDEQSVALVEETVKTAMAAAIFFTKPAAEVQNALKGECERVILCGWLAGCIDVCMCEYSDFGFVFADGHHH